MSLFCAGMGLSCVPHKQAELASVSNSAAIAKRMREKFPLPQGAGGLPLQAPNNFLQNEDDNNILQRRTFVAADHAATKIAKEIVGKFHAEFRRAYPESDLLEPAVIISQDNSTINAFVQNVAYCVPVPVVSYESPSFGSMWMGSTNGVMRSVLTNGGFRKCPAWAQMRPDLADELAVAIRVKNPECDVSLESGQIRMKEACLSNFAPRGAAGTVVQGAGAGVIINSGSFKKLDEMQLEAIIAHELGHYYLAHTVLDAEANLLDKNVTNSMRYFFRINDYVNRAQKPIEEKSAEFFEVAKQVEGMGWVSQVPRIAGAKWHARTLSRLEQMFSDYGLLVTQMGEPIPFNISLSCGSFVRAKEKFGKLFEGEHNSLQYFNRQSEYLKVEGLGSQCLAALSSQSMAQIKQQALLRGNSAQYEKFSKSLRLRAGLESNAELPEWNQLVTKIDLAEVETAEKWNRIVGRARDLGLGFYTVENQADEFAAHLLALAGKNPQAMVGMFFRLMGHVQHGVLAPTLDTVSLEECRKGYLNNWQHWLFNGKPWVPFFGVVSETHPDSCFRIYQADMEARSLGFSNAINMGRSSTSYIDAANAL